MANNKSNFSNVVLFVCENPGLWTPCKGITSINQSSRSPGANDQTKRYFEIKIMEISSVSCVTNTVSFKHCPCLTALYRTKQTYLCQKLQVLRILLPTQNPNLNIFLQRYDPEPNYLILRKLFRAPKIIEVSILLRRPNL